MSSRYASAVTDRAPVFGSVKLTRAVSPCSLPTPDSSCCSRSIKPSIFSPCPLCPSQQFPAIAAFVVWRVDDGVVQIVGAAARSRHPATHFGSEPDGFTTYRVGSPNIAIFKIDEVHVPQRLVLAGRHRDGLPGLGLHGLFPLQSGAILGGPVF